MWEIWIGDDRWEPSGRGTGLLICKEEDRTVAEDKMFTLVKLITNRSTNIFLVSDGRIVLPRAEWINRF